MISRSFTGRILPSGWRVTSNRYGATTRLPVTKAWAWARAASAAADDALAAATAELTRNEFVAPYLFEVREKDGRIVPVKEREIIRAAGPTVHPHTGKQAAHA